MIYHVCGQTPVWNKFLPAYSNSSALQVSLQPYEDGYLLYCQKNIVQLSPLGEITGAIHTPYNPVSHVFGGFIRPKTDLITGEKYFLVGGNNLSGTNAMAFHEYRPGQGFVQETLLDESWGGTAFSPVFIDLSDSTYLMLGRKYFRQITHRPGQGVITNWEKPNDLGTPNAGVKTPDGIVGVGQNGVIFAVDFTGNTLWADTTAYRLRDIQIAANGFLAVGSTADSKAVLIKLSQSGIVEWTTIYDNDLFFNHLLIESNGSLTVTGQSDALKTVLRHLAADGVSIWRQTYEPGVGRTVLRQEDGYVIAGQGQGSCFALRTDEAGFSSLRARNLDPHKRRILTDKLRVVASPSSNLFFDQENSAFSPDSLTSLFVAAAPWLGALDQDSLLHVAADTYVISGRSDYRTGFSAGSAVDFNRVWRVTKTQIDGLRQDWADNGVLDQPVPFDISTWPAKGNPGFIYNLDFTKTISNKALLPAPFADANGDGLYNLTDGDYPRIKGDQMAWWILTDDTIHTQSNGRPFIADLAISMYTYDCATYALSERSLLVDFDIINRSENAYNQMFAGIWVAPTIGCAETKLLGSLPASNAFYTYGRDTTDVNCPVPSQTSDWSTAVSFVNHPLNKFIYYNNGGTNPAPPYGTDDPNQDTEYYNYIRAKWRDGTSPTYNGQPLDFVFPDNPADPAGNSMCTNYPQFPDRRMIGSHGPFNMAPNDTFQWTVAFTYHPNIPLPCPDIFGTVKNDLEALHTLLNSGALDAPVHLLSNVQLSPGQSALLDATVPSATGYTWSNGATTATISVAQAGAYSVTITRSTGCASVETVLVTAATPTHEADWLDDLRIFPNPSAGQFKVEMRGAAQSSVECTLYNSLGQFVQRQVVDFSSGAGNYTFNCAYLPTGIYTLRLRAGEKMRHERVVLQH